MKRFQRTANHLGIELLTLVRAAVYRFLRLEAVEQLQAIRDYFEWMERIRKK